MLAGRDQQIIKAFEELALEEKKAVQWTELKRKTKLNDATFTRGLQSLIKHGDVVEKELSPRKKLYALAKYEMELLEAVSNIQSRDSNRLKKLMLSVLEQLQTEGFEHITLNLLANKMAEPPHEITRLAYQFSPKYGLTIGSEIRKKSLWKTIKFQLAQVGGAVEKFYAQKMILGDQDPKTGWYKKSYQDKEEIGGILVLKGATELSSIASKLDIHHLRKYQGNYQRYGLLLTTKELDQEDKLWVNDSLFLVKEVERKFDGTDLAFYIVHACEVPGASD